MTGTADNIHMAQAQIGCTLAHRLDAFAGEVQRREIGRRCQLVEQAVFGATAVDNRCDFVNHGL
ncbi:hypothetical protein D3C77_678340 [compost metagenome]